MTKDELIAKGKDKVRRDSNLMRIYITLFTEQFGFAPVCAGCSFSSDWTKFVGGPLKQSITLNQQKYMNVTFKLKRNTSDILSYRMDVNGKPKTFRTYANKMNEVFAINFLTFGSKEEIAERKKLFAVEPKIEKPRKPRSKKTK